MAFRSEFTELMQKDAYGWAFEAYDVHNAVYPQLFDVKPSDSSYEKDTSAVGMGQLTERPEGNDIIESNPLEGFTVIGKNRTFSDSFSMTAEFVKDTPKEKIANVMQDVASSWGEGLIATKETFGAKFFNNGGLTAGHEVFNNTITGVVDDPTGDLCYDGKPFFNLTGNTRSSKGGGTYFNGLALALSATNLRTGYQLMTDTNNRDERDEVIALKPNVLVIPPALKFTAKTILESEHIVGSANNDINTAMNLVSPIEWHYLTDTDAWFLGMAKKGLIWQERENFLIDFFQDEKSKKFFATIDARWGARMKNFRYWVGSNFSTSKL